MSDSAYNNMCSICQEVILNNCARCLQSVCNNCWIQINNEIFCSRCRPSEEGEID